MKNNLGWEGGAGGFRRQFSGSTWGEEVTGLVREGDGMSMEELGG